MEIKLEWVEAERVRKLIHLVEKLDEDSGYLGLDGGQITWNEHTVTILLPDAKEAPCCDS